ncbi:nuclear transport factor 2 family protein [Coralloluteibacterium stylophorae]|uniref:Nuclear transport factor 2 family protein n=2 Tax=Coralloluteibacterium stylophorae TaxID=1776034 RepID=A0A8J8AW61_9GAMM|nr:nuclear transport factor 2 family protein [Coralloluteibacterium stylophorae]
MDPDACRQLIARYVEAYNSFDLTALGALVTEDVRFENVVDGQLTAVTEGRDRFLALAAHSRGLFAARSQRVLALAFEGEVAVARVAFRGVLAHDMRDGPSAGTLVELEGQTLFGFRAGAISAIVDRS